MPDETNKSIYAEFWDKYVTSIFPNMKDASKYSWPGDEWGNEQSWQEVYEKLFERSKVAACQRAVEIGPGSGKYTAKVLADSHATIRAYDVSVEFMKVCGERCRDAVSEKRLSLHLIDTTTRGSMLADLKAAGWLRTVNVFYSIDAMVHVDLQYLMEYLITAACVLETGGHLALTLANATSEKGFLKLLADTSIYFPIQDRPNAKFEWLSPDIVRYVLTRLGFEISCLDASRRDILVSATLVAPDVGDALARYL